MVVIVCADCGYLHHFAVAPDRLGAESPPDRAADRISPSEGTLIKIRSAVR